MPVNHKSQEMSNCNHRKRSWLLCLQILSLLTGSITTSQDHLFQPNSHNHRIQQQAIQQRGDENCETARSEIQLIKEEYDELGRLVRTCNDEVHVTKCEGFCNSQVQPSVISITGFLKECFCCRETFLREKIITLKHCYDPDGQRIIDSLLGSMEVRLKEPSECRCYKCGDFSR